MQLYSNQSFTIEGLYATYKDNIPMSRYIAEATLNDLCGLK
jgi:hypothetical protein